MVAARIQRSCPFVQGAPDRRERMTASSQGSLITLGIQLARQTRNPVPKVMGHVRFGRTEEVLGQGSIKSHGKRIREDAGSLLIEIEERFLQINNHVVLAFFRNRVSFGQQAFLLSGGPSRIFLVE